MMRRPSGASTQASRISHSRGTVQSKTRVPEGTEATFKPGNSSCRMERVSRTPGPVMLRQMGNRRSANAINGLFMVQNRFYKLAETALSAPFGRHQGYRHLPFQVTAFRYGTPAAGLQQRTVRQVVSSLSRTPCTTKSTFSLAARADTMRVFSPVRMPTGMPRAWAAVTPPPS